MKRKFILYIMILNELIIRNLYLKNMDEEISRKYIL